jgi:hypothetical protein
MALYSPLMSPGVFTREVDLTNGVPNVPSSTAVTVGNFRWGPVEEPVLINNEAKLAKVFGNPDYDTAVDFHNASYYLRYSDDLYIVRKVIEQGTDAAATAEIDSLGTTLSITVDEAGDWYTSAPTVSITAADSGDTPTITATYNSATKSITGFTITSGTTPYLYNSTPTITLTDGTPTPAFNAYGPDSSLDAPAVFNETQFDQTVGTLISNGHTIVAKYPGELGNSLKISFVNTDSAFANWAYKEYFDAAPGTSNYVSQKGDANDEVHAVIIDEDGEFTGTKGQVLEVYPFLSLARDAKDPQGSSIYVREVINNASKYIWLVDFPSAMGTVAGSGTNGTGKDYGFTGAVNVSLTNGQNSGALGLSEIETGFDLIQDVNTYTVDFLVAPSLSNATDHKTLVNYLVTIAQSTRKDCMVVASPARSSVINQADPVTQILSDINGFTRSSYLAVDNNFLKVYDKFNDQYIYIPAASSTAGLMAATDNNFAPWYSPAGTRRGQYLGVTSLAYSPNNSERDELYKAGVNPISNIPGQGILLFGDKTHLARPSAFDRINVRRLFLVLERAISQAAQNILFEFNDEFTRAEFVNIVEPVLRDVKGRRGITDFLVVCDETNNTPEIIDTNQFVASLFIKPARSINFITLNFVAVRTGVSFEEVVGNGNAGV